MLFFPTVKAFEKYLPGFVEELATTLVDNKKSNKKIVTEKNKNVKISPLHEEINHGETVLQEQLRFYHGVVHTF